MEFDILSQCDRCGKIDFCAFTEDPFLTEVFPEDEEEDGPYEKKFWCEDCYDDRKDEV